MYHIEINNFKVKSNVCSCAFSCGILFFILFSFHCPIINNTGGNITKYISGQC